MLHGDLRSLHDGPIRVFAKTAAEAIEAVSRQVKGFAPKLKRGYRRVKAVGFDTVESLFEPLKTDEIHLVPQFNGGKRGGFIQILLGAVLLAASFLIPGLGATFAGMLMKAGALLILGGISQLLSPTPSSESEEQRSHYLGAPGNTTRIGTRIPILYGTHKVSGHFLSFDVNATQVAKKA